MPVPQKSKKANGATARVETDNAGLLVAAAVALAVTLTTGWFGIEYVMSEAAGTDASGLDRLTILGFLGFAGLLAANWLVIGGLLRLRAQPRAPNEGKAEPEHAPPVSTDGETDLEEMLGSVNERFKSLAASIPGVIYQRRVGSDGDIRYTYISEGAKDLFGVAPEEIISDPRALFDCHGPEYHATFHERLLQASRDLTMWDVEAQIINRNGEEKWTHAIARPRRQPDGSVLWDGIILDATRMKRAEMELHSAMEQAESASRAKSEFLAVMSHEIRTPLNGVLGMAELLGRTNLNERQKRFLTTITQSGESLLSVVNDILDITKIEAGEQTLADEVFDPGQCVEDVVALFRGMAEKKGLALEHRVEDDLPEFVRGDPVRLRQVLANVINNAVKFTTEGSVSISTRLLRTSDDVATLEFRVDDTGVGIAADDLPRLFEAFHQVDSSYSRKHGGTGLGLTISHRLVEMMGGEIDVHSEEGAGTTFTLVIPLQVENDFSGTLVVADADSAPNPSAARKLAEVRILVAEDNPVNKEVILENLWAMGCTVDTAENGLEAVEAFEQNTYDVVLMDCQMPQMDGFEATQKIREIELIRGIKDGKNHHTPIIAVSAYTMPGDREHCLLVGMDDHLGKPFTFEQIQETLNYWLKIDRRSAATTA